MVSGVKTRRADASIAMVVVGSSDLQLPLCPDSPPLAGRLVHRDHLRGTLHQASMITLHSDGRHSSAAARLHTQRGSRGVVTHSFG